LSAGSNGAALWNAATGEQLKTFVLPSATFNRGTFSPDDKHVALGGTAGIGISDVASGQQVGELFGSITAGYAIDYSHDGSRLVTGSNDQSAYVFDTATGVVIETLEGQEHDVYFATFSSSDRFVATAAKDNLAAVWDISSVEEGSALEIACARLGTNTSLVEIELRYGLDPLTPICGDNPPVPAEWSKLR
jgi:WD40 repeat protein